MGFCFLIRRWGKHGQDEASLPAFVEICCGLKLKGVAKYCQGVANAPPRHTLNEALPIVIHYHPWFLHKSKRIK